MVHPPRFHKGRQPACVHGFSLVEVIVVIGLIAILATLALPALNSARTTADSAAAVASLKQVGIALASVAQEHNNTLPVGYRFVGSPPDYIRRLTGSEFRRPLTIAAWKSLLVNKLAMKEGYRPSDGRYDFLDTTPYGMNWYLNSLSEDPNSPSTWSMFKVPKPGGTVVLGDGFILGTSAGSRIKYLEQPGRNESISYRHPGKRASFLFADWHVELATAEQVAARPDWFEISKQQ